MGRNGDIEVVEARWVWSAHGPASRPLPPEHFARGGRHRIRRPVAALAAGPATATWRRRPAREAVAGLAAAVVIVGLGLGVAAATSPTAPTAAALAADAPVEGLPIVPSAPALDFVYPIVPAVVPQGPAGPVAPVLGYSGLVPPMPVPPAVPVPPAITPSTATTTARAEGSGDTRTGPTQGQTTPSTPRPSASPTPTPTPAPLGPPVKAQLPGAPGLETLVPVGPAEGDLPDVLPGNGLGLWSGGTGKPAVLVLGADHPEEVALLAPGPPEGRLILVEHDGGFFRHHLMGDPKVIPRAAAVKLLAETTSALVLVVASDGDTVTLLEAAQ